MPMVYSFVPRLRLAVPDHRRRHHPDPILNAYGQWVIRDYDENGEYMGTMSHILRVFLIDESRQIRNIYSTSFLHADTVANDVRSLLIEANTGPESEAES